MGKKIFFIFLFVLFTSAAGSVYADIIGEKKSFYIDSNYDSSNRSQTTAILLKKTQKIYFYIDEKIWNLESQDKNAIYGAISDLEKEFDNNIYPVLTVNFGKEWDPGIDKDTRITVLIHEMKDDSGGYFRSNDEYSKFEISDSNEREMLYLNSKHITSPLAKSFLAHEFVHLITFNQKEKTYNISEEIWLNEARAEYAPTLLGYNNGDESNLKQRIQTFLENPVDPLIEWKNKKADYGVINLFTHYLADHYGVNVLKDSLQYSKKGIESINYALKKNGFPEKFSDIFTDWAIAVVVNDCNYGPKYCYLNPNLTNVHVNPKINFLPVSGESTLTFSDFTKNWTGNWYKVIGGKGTLKFKFSGKPDSNFKVPYITINKSGGYNVKFLNIGTDGNGEIVMENFGVDTVSLVIIPLVLKTEEIDSFHFFSWSVSAESQKEQVDLINKMLVKIEELKREISKVLTRINAILAQRGGRDNFPNPISYTCNAISRNLYYGLQATEVKCLQNFLKSQGQEIYPEGLITGYFGNLTKNAVIRFQQKYGINPSGNIDSSTVGKMNELLTK